MKPPKETHKKQGSRYQDLHVGKKSVITCDKWEPGHMSQPSQIHMQSHLNLNGVREIRLARLPRPSQSYPKSLPLGKVEGPPNISYLIKMNYSTQTQDLIINLSLDYKVKLPMRYLVIQTLGNLVVFPLAISITHLKAHSPLACTQIVG